MAKGRTYKETKALVKTRMMLMAEARSNGDSELSRDLMLRKLTWENLEQAESRLMEQETMFSNPFGDWRTQVNTDVSEFLATKGKNYTQGQKDFVREMRIIEAALGDFAEKVKTLYSSDDIEELANQFYVKLDEGLSDEELLDLEAKFRETHSIDLKIKRAKNPFKGIDFLGNGGTNL